MKILLPLAFLLAFLPAVLLNSKLSNVAATISNMLIGGAAPVQPLASQSYPGYGYRIYTSTPGSVSGSLTYSAATQWVSGLSAFYAQ